MDCIYLDLNKGIDKVTHKRLLDGKLFEIQTFENSNKRPHIRVDQDELNTTSISIGLNNVFYLHKGYGGGG